MNSVFIYIGLSIVIWLIFSFRSIAEIIRVRRTATTSIGSLLEAGRIEVTGRTGERTITSPFTQTACVLWQIEVEEWRYSGGRGGGHYWATIHKEASKDPFDIVDITGKVSVFPDTEVELILNQDWQTSGAADEFTTQTQEALERFSVETTGFWGSNKKFRLTENYIRAGEKIFILGNIKLEDGIKMIKSEATARLLISDQSEKRVLNELYSRIEAVAVMIIIGWVIIWFIGITAR